MRFSVLSAVGTLLVVVAIARMVAFVVHDPLLGFANQYDMIRTSACVGLYPDLPADKRDAATPEAPLERYKLGPRAPEECRWSADALLAAAVVAKQRLFGNVAESFPALRQLGMLELALAALAILIFAIAFWPYPLASFLHGLTVAAVLADPAVTLWFQTLYTEFPVLLGIYVVVAAIVAALLRESLPRWLAILAAIGTLLTAGAKLQFFGLPFALLLIAAPRLWASSRRTLAILAAIAIAAGAWQPLAPRSDVDTHANRANTYLGTILPASGNLPTTLSNLELPEKCAEVSGATWNAPRGADLRAACPEALSLPAAAFVRLTREDAQTLARAAVRVIPATGNPLLGHLGLVARESWGTLDNEPMWLRSAFGWIAAHLPAQWYLGLTLFAIACVIPALALWGVTLVRGANADAHPYGAYLLMLQLVALYSLATTIYGDGLSQSARHDIPGVVAYAAFALAALVGLLFFGAVGIGLRVLAGIAALTALAVALVATQWALRQPLALGEVVEPSAAQVPRENLVLKGWAVDPAGVNAIRFEAGSYSGWMSSDRMLPSWKTARVHPSYPGSNRAWFEFPVPQEWLAQPEVRLRVEVENKSGVVTEIDRRRIRPQ
jgi:hypothetical protein